MSSISELTSLLWWLMLLSSTAIILHDIGSAVLPKGRQHQVSPGRRKIQTPSEDEIATITKRIRRGLQRPANFRLLQRDVGQTIVQAALASKGFSMTRIPEGRQELIEQVIKDLELIGFVRESIAQPSAPISRGEMLIEFERAIRMLEIAENELR